MKTWRVGDLMAPEQCIGITRWGSKCGISRGVRYPPTSRPVHHNRKTGPLPWHSGPTRICVTSPRCSTATARYSILRFGECIVFFRSKGCRDEPRAAVIGRKVPGAALVYPDNPSVVSRKLDLRHAHSSYKRADHRSIKLVSLFTLASMWRGTQVTEQTGKCRASRYTKIPLHDYDAFHADDIYIT